MNKICTNIKQSQKLIELGINVNTADMYYSSVPVREWKDKTDTSKGTQVVFKDQIFALEQLSNSQIGEGDTYAWSLSALLDILSYPSLHKTLSGWRCDAYNKERVSYILGEPSNSQVDTCVGMIIKLSELKML